MSKTIGHMSYKKHGYWVRLKGSDREGRISYYDLNTGLVWVVWEAKNYTFGEFKYKVKHPSAGGYKPKELVYTPFEPLPWIDLKDLRKVYNHRRGA